MKNVLFSIIFIAALFAGVGLSSASNVFNKIDELIHPNCARWDAETVEKPLFNFEELKKYSGKKLRATKNTQFSENVGRISIPVAVGKDKFMFLVHWKKSPHNGEDQNELFDKNRFEKYGIEIAD